MNMLVFRRNLLISLLVLLPVLLFVGSHYTMAPEDSSVLPTGFFNGEAPYYMANARQYIDEGFDSLFYGNPFSYLKEGQRVYFQFQTYILALLIKLLPFDLGIIWIGFGLFFATFLMFQMINLFNIMGVERKYIAFLLIAYAWGGGIHSSLGFIVEYFSSFNIIEGIKSFEKFEVADGWWMHSIGRNFLMPNYTFYHFLVITGILLLAKKSSKLLYGLCFVLSFSHPFVGAQFIFTLLVWGIFERFYLRSIESKYFSVSGFFLLMIMHVSYYFLFLKTSSEHVLQELQWSVSADTLYDNWAMLAKNFIPSYLLVFGLFAYQIRRPQLFFRFFKNFLNRFLFFFGFINFILANHEFAMKPIQPIHFTHGMVWFPFMLLGRSSIISLIRSINMSSTKKLSKLAITLFFIIFFSDNFTWMMKRGYQTHIGNSQTEISLHKNDKEVIDYINGHINKSSLFFVDNLYLGYNLCVYTSARVFASHNIITPDSAQRKKIQKRVVATGIVPDTIQDKEVYVVRKASGYSRIKGEILFQNDHYELVLIKK